MCTYLSQVSKAFYIFKKNTKKCYRKKKQKVDNSFYFVTKAITIINFCIYEIY